MSWTRLQILRLIVAALLSATPRPAGATTKSLAAGTLLTATIAGASIIKQNIDLARATGRPLSKREIFHQTIEVTNQLIGGLGLSSTLAGQAAVAASKPMLAQGTALGPLLAGAISSVVLVGATTGASELWIRAVNRLPKDERELGQTLLDTLRDTYKSGRPEEAANHARVFAKIVRNMGEIAFFNSRERGMWLYDSWRHAAEGRTVTSLGATLAASYFLGPLAAVLIGSVGAGLLVPEYVNDVITEKIVSARQTANDFIVSRCMNHMTAVFRLSESDTYNRRYGIGRSFLLSHLSACERERNSYATVLMDKIRSAYTRWVVARNRASAATEAGLGKGDHTDAALRADGDLRKATQELLDFYKRQLERTKGLAGELKGSLTGPMMQAEYKRLSEVHFSLDSALTRLKTDYFFRTMIVASSLNGFNEFDWTADALPSEPSQDVQTVVSGLETAIMR